MNNTRLFGGVDTSDPFYLRVPPLQRVTNPSLVLLLHMLSAHKMTDIFWDATLQNQYLPRERSFAKDHAWEVKFLKSVLTNLFFLCFISF